MFSLLHWATVQHQF